MLTYLSLGAGVQSTALLVLSARGVAPKADVAIFADTQDEPKWVYEHLERLRAWSPIEIVTVTVGNLEADLRAGHRYGGKRKGTSAIPGYTLAADGSKGHLRRYCSTDYKVTPIQREVRRRIGRKRNAHATALIGISLDEADRMKDSTAPWLTFRYPLVELSMRRNDCVKVIEGTGLPVPRKSACRFCPYHSDEYWRMLKTEAPEDWNAACDFDSFVRRGLRGVEDEVFLHVARQPLSVVDLNENQQELFGNECEGVCGV